MSRLSKLSEEFNVRLHFSLFLLKIHFTHSIGGYSDHEPSSMHVAIELSFPSLAHVITFSADPGATMTFVAGGALKPVGGHILSHASATRIYLRKGANPLSKTVV